jgi:signal transduction histidine kinase
LIFDSKNNKVLFINKKGREVLGISAESIISADWVSLLVSKDGQEDTNKAISNLVSGKETISNIQNTVVTSSKEERSIVWRFSLLDSESESMRPVIGTGIDVTELTKAKTTIGQLRELDRLKNEVLNIATHELKTPLISIVGLTEVMEQQKDKLSPEHASYISIIHKEGLKLTNLIKSMLSATRNEKGKMAVSKTYFNIDDLALSMSTSLSVLAKRTASKIAVEIKDKGVSVNSDKEKIQEVISNFVDNAVKYGTNGQTIRVVVSKPDKEHVKVEVIGAGQGISEEMQKKLFLKFSQLEPSLSRSQDGMGLGLYICKQVIDSLDGEIGVVSQLGQGATFYFILPLV